MGRLKGGHNKPKVIENLTGKNLSTSEDSLKKTEVNQTSDGGSNPTSSLHIKEMRIEQVERKIIKDFIEKYHYSHNINGLKIDYCFALKYNNEILGASLLGKPATRGVVESYQKNYGNGEVTEIRRLCCIDETPKNTESYFISKILLWIKNNTNIRWIISYADETYGHHGIIYKASNFKHIGFVPPSKQILYNGKLYHQRTIDNTYNGKPKPFTLKIKEAMKNGSAKIIKTQQKNIYIYEIKRKQPKER